MTKRHLDLAPYQHQEEGQYFDRKSLWRGPEGQKVVRDRKVVRDQIAEYAAAFTNAGVLRREEGGRRYFPGPLWEAFGQSAQLESSE